MEHFKLFQLSYVERARTRIEQVLMYDQGPLDFMLKR